MAYEHYWGRYDHQLHGDRVITPSADNAVLEWGKNADGGAHLLDHKWYGSASTRLITLDASADTLTFDLLSLVFGDDDFIKFGDSNDVTFEWDTAATPDQFIVDCAADDTILTFGKSAATQLSFDLRWYGDDTNGGTLVYCDASANLIYTTGIDFQFKDDDFLVFGTGAGASGDVNVEWDTAATPDQLIVDCAADDTVLTIGKSAATQLSFDVRWYANEASGASLLYCDASANLIYTTGIDFQFKDDDFLVFGTGAGATGDVNIEWDTTATPDQLIMACTADDTLWTIGDGTNSFDIDLFGGSAAAYISWDASANDLKFEDSVSLMFGTGATAGRGTAGDVEIRWDGTDLDILGAADDLVVKIGNGTNSLDLWVYGETASDYVQWDASKNELSFAGAAHLNPSGVVQFFDDFVSDTLATDNWTTDLDTGTAAIVAAVNGTIALTTAAGDNNHVECASEEFTTTSVVKVFEARVKIDDITTACMNVGLSDVKTAGATNIAIGIGAGDAIAIDAGVADFAGFAYDTDADTDGWFGAIVYGAAASELEGAGATAPANGTYQTLRMEFSSTRTVSFFIGGTLYGSATTNVLDATTAMSIYLAVCNRAGGIARVMTIDYVYMASTRA